MSFKRLYYNPAVHGSVGGNYYNLHQGDSQTWMVLTNRTGFFYVLGNLVATGGPGRLCFGTITDGQILSCIQWSGTLAAGVVLPMPQPDNRGDVWVPTTSEPWVVYTDTDLSGGPVECYFESHRW